MATLSSSRREGFAQWWQLRSRSERTVLTIGATLLAVTLAGLFIWQPLVQDVQRLTRQLAADRMGLAEARRQADAIAGLAKSPPAVAPGDARAALDAVLAQQGLKSAASAIERTDNERIRLTFESIAFDQLAAFLDALQHGAQLRAVELVATARVEPGQIRADLTLAR
jgi:type II secretory pathway component PulM